MPIRRIESHDPSRQPARDDKGEYEGCIRSKISFYHYCQGTSRTRLETHVGYRWELEMVDVIAIYYDRSKPETLHNAIYEMTLTRVGWWHPKVLHFAGGAPICLVGYLYSSLEASSLHSLQNVATREQVHLISTKEGEEAARQIGAVAYIEWTEGTNPMWLLKEFMWYGYYYHLD
ncbi:hypothetical protein CPB86DRAFT_791752 [Serendipita vermifera]|nr:hypothetical protein CPB86DRAFT_791752 [Serendipita vermifera]